MKGVKEFDEKALTEKELKYVRSFKINGTQKRCHKIAIMLNIMSKGKIRYYEGVMTGGIPHSWGVLNDKVVDLIRLNKNSSLGKRESINYLGYEVPHKEVENFLGDGVYDLIHPDKVYDIVKKLKVTK